MGTFLEYLKKSINSQYSKFISLVPKIEEVQDLVYLQQKYIFEGRRFYHDEFHYFEQDLESKTKIANTGLLLPIFKFESKVLSDIYNISRYPARQQGIKYEIPSFLVTDNYAVVVNKIFTLPPQ